MRRVRPRALSARDTSKERKFFSQSVSFPLRDAPPLELEEFWRRRDRSEINADHRWECLGPFSVAGRVTSLAIHPADRNFWVAGSAAGGVWISRDAGASWKQTWSRFATQSIGAVGWIELWDWCIVVATGEANMHNDYYPGSGLYYSMDNGLTWEGLTREPPGSALAEDVRRQPRRIGCLAFKTDPIQMTKDSYQLLMGSVYLDDRMPAGLYFVDIYGNTKEGARSWPCLRWGTRSYNCHSLLIHPADRRIIYAAVQPDGSDNGIWRSRDAGESWEHLDEKNGLPPGENFRRTSLAFAPSNPDIIYALASNHSDQVLGLYRTTNGGKRWTDILRGRPPKERQMSYNNTIAVHPQQPFSVVWGGTKLYRTDDGRHWRKITSRDRGARNYVHEDHHALVWLEDDTIISGNDGGVAVSKDGGRSWEDRSRGMVTTMFYDLDVAPSNSKALAGGTQDNGTLVAGVKDREDNFFKAIAGDGAWTVFDPADSESLFASSNNFDVRWHRRGKPWDFHGWNSVSPKPEQISDEEKAQRAVTVLAIEASTRKGSKRLYAGTARLWCTDTNGRRWRRVSEVFDRSPISAIAISNVSPRVMYVGTSKGGIFRSRDGGGTWSQNLAGPDLPERAITSIQTHPKLKDTVVVTVAATGVAGSGVDIHNGEYLPYGHVFRSKDGGGIWEEIDRRELPNVAYFASAYETHPPYRLFVAGDLGVWAEVDKHWVNINGNLPSVVVSDLVYHHRDRTLTAATYGRGVWRMRPGRKLASRPGRSAKAVRDTGGLHVDPGLAIPVQRTPDRALLNRTDPLTVDPEPSAAGYRFEVKMRGWPESRIDCRVEPKMDVAAREDAGRWRVSSICDGMCSRPSGWRSFAFRK